MDSFKSTAGLRSEIKEYHKQFDGTLVRDWPVSLTEHDRQSDRVIDSGQTPGASIDLNDKKRV